MVGVNLTAMWRGRQQRCWFVHSTASLITFLPHHVRRKKSHKAQHTFIFSSSQFTTAVPTSYQTGQGSRGGLVVVAKGKLPVPITNQTHFPTSDTGP